MITHQAWQQYISIAIYLFIAINIFIIALFSILQYIIAAKKLQYYCNILQKYVGMYVYTYNKYIEVYSIVIARLLFRVFPN